MAFGSKGKEDDPMFSAEKHPLPRDLKQRLDVVSRSFFTSRMRNLDMLEDKSQRLYAFMTYYDGNGYCWVQPTKTRSYDTEAEYDRYIRRINKDAREDKLGYISNDALRVGMDVVAQYEVDGRWYRAIVVGEPIGGQWSVLFSDFGNLQLCDVEEIRKPIHEPTCDHFHAPLQAICCRLYNIVANTAADREKIDMYLTDFYAKNVNQFLEMYVRNVRPDYVVDCDLFIRKRGSIGGDRLYRRHIGQALVDGGIATFADPIAASAIMPDKKPETDVVEIDLEDAKSDILTTPRVVSYTL